MLPETYCCVWSAFPSDSDYFDPSNRAYMFNLVVDDLATALQQAAMGGAQLVGRRRNWKTESLVGSWIRRATRLNSGSLSNAWHPGTTLIFASR